MGCRLYARKKPKAKWPWSFSGSLRDNLRNKYHDEITDSAIPYLEGLRDNESDPANIKDLNEIIDALHGDEEIELKYEC